MASTAAHPGLTIGQRIVWARKRKGISQEGLAKLVGTSRRHMIRLEKDTHRPGPALRARLAEATDQPASLFSDDEEDEESELVAVLLSALRAIIREEMGRT